jgi:hypothetical protein
VGNGSSSSSRAELPGRKSIIAFALAGVGAGFLVAATFIPVNGGGRAGYSESIYDSSASKELQLFALEPVGVGVLACLAILIALVYSGARTWVAGMLLAFGLQSGLLFVAYFGGAAFGNPEYNSFSAGSALGLIGAGLLVLSGALYLVWQARCCSPRTG